jgi:hypothetical protein
VSLKIWKCIDIRDIKEIITTLFIAWFAIKKTKNSRNYDNSIEKERDIKRKSGKIHSFLGTFSQNSYKRENVCVCAYMRAKGIVCG